MFSSCMNYWMQDSRKRPYLNLLSQPRLVRANASTSTSEHKAPLNTMNAMHQSLGKSDAQS